MARKRAWVGDDPSVARLREVMHSMVRRDDKKVVIELSETIERLGMDEARMRAVWEAYGQCETKAERKRFAAKLAERGELP